MCVTGMISAQIQQHQCKFMYRPQGIDANAGTGHT